ncbi:MAG TPA: murein biosynthesis integral membrane protein MurJ [Lentisphaeria bacterium]|nr:MAG: murein biosynthesis integral membrane protein MurJ [Lentisphaerae bacterium GWF2_50_93]HCE46660.1 murein biosynthesis integral membrane protein MurJ [Lentisphaeria bacterium]
MTERKHNLIRHSSGVSLATIVSRILGLAREMLLSRIIGGGEFMTAWAMGFMIPNLLRRLLGEGALGTALVPIMTYTFERENKESARKKLTVITAVLGLILAAICIIVSMASLLAIPFLHSAPARVLMTFKLLPILMPYSFFICIIGVFGSVMNSMNRYFLPAVASITLNLVMILCLLFVCPYYSSSPMDMLYALSVSVLVSGVLQLAMMLWMLEKDGMLPSIRFSGIFSEPVVKELYHLTLPGIIGASFLQISFVIDRTMACYISDYAVPALYFSDRLIDLPIGVFAVAMGSVVLTDLSRYAAKNDIAGMLSSFKHAMENIFFLCIPVAVFTLVFSKPLVHVFYYGGKFGDREVAETVWAMLFYALGIPAFSAIKIIVSGFNARKDMKTPVKVAVFCIVINIILNLILMWPLKQGGIALSTTICSFLNCSILLYLLRKELGNIHLSQIIPSTLRTTAIALYALAISYFVYLYTVSIQISFLPRDIVPLTVTGSVFVVLYLVVSVVFESPEAKDWLKLLRLRK